MSDDTVGKLPMFSTKVHRLLVKARKKSQEDNKPFTLLDLLSIQQLGEKSINSILKVIVEEPMVAHNMMKYVMYYRNRVTCAKVPSSSSTILVGIYKNCMFYIYI